jgi:hypothetical protein
LNKGDVTKGGVLEAGSLKGHRPLQPTCPQLHLAFAGLPEAHLSLQYICPPGTMQLQAGWAHLLVMEAVLLSVETPPSSRRFRMNMIPGRLR